jgi:hypothetical protein
MAEEGYTTIFHPGEQGATVHNPGTLTITSTESPILQRCKLKGAKLWTITAENRKKMEQANDAYNLPSISQTVKYLRAAAGFPVADTWIKAIKAGNYNTWPTITPATVRRHFPESGENPKRTHEETAPGSTINKGTSRNNRSKQYTYTCKDERRIHQNPQRISVEILRLCRSRYLEVPTTAKV